MTQLNIGTGWMLQPPTRPGDDAAYNQIIETMDLEHVRRLMCPKSGGNPIKCLDCAGFKTCRAGQRAVRLVDEITKPTEQKPMSAFIRKWERAEEPKGNQKSVKPEPEEEKPSNHPTYGERDELRKACESGNAWQFIMNTRGLGKNAAGEHLTKLIRKFPGIAAEFGGSRRIMQRPRNVTVTGMEIESKENAPVDPCVAKEPTSEQKAVKVQAQPEQAAKQPEKPKNSHNAMLREQARERCRTIMSRADPVQALIDEGAPENLARSLIFRWARKYPDLCEGIDLDAFKKPRGRRKKKAEETPMEAATEIRTETAAADDDLIGLADFLSEMGVKDEPEAAPEEPEEAKKEDPMLESMKAKAKELEAEKERLRAEIQKAEERIKCIEDQQEALELCITRFGQ